MKNSDSPDQQPSPAPAAPPESGSFSSLWQQLKGKRISYLTLPLLVMATVTEFVILATGWKYQQVVCLPKGMGVTFFGIGPIGATILAVELLKLPLAIWTASRQGFQKFFMLFAGLPLICVLTFQLVKDMAVYEMGVALAPAEQMLKDADKQEVRIAELNGELAAIDQKKTDRDSKLADLAGRKAKANADLEDSLKRIDDDRQDAISLTDYQKSELSDVEARQATIIKQFDEDTAQLNQAITDLRARRETELARASQWSAEEARIDNAYKQATIAYDDQEAQYLKDKAAYDKASFLMRPLMKKPMDPGVPPQRASNPLLKPDAIADLDNQIKAKEAELATVDSQRRDRVAQVNDGAHNLRQEFESRSSTKREASDRKRDQLLAAQAATTTQMAGEEKQIDQDYDTAAQKADAIRAELADCRNQAEGFYEARVTAIENTQVHRIATTVEIVRGLFMGQRPVSITISAKDRGDLYTDQISMVRIWVYPVLAFIVAFLPTLMVEIGFSTLFHPERKRPAYRLGFFGRRMHWLYVRAGRQKILRAERLAGRASAEIAARDRALAAKDAELQAARQAINTTTEGHTEFLKRKDVEQAEQLKLKNEEWVAKLASMADTLNRTVIEKDAIRDLQKSEIERQIQLRQNAWSDRLTQMRQELDDQRTAMELERTTMMQVHQKKLMEVTEESKTQVIQARRQAADAELAAVEATAKLSHDLKEALLARDEVETQLKQQLDTFAIQLSQAKEDSARELEKAVRQEKHRFERQQLEFGKTLRQREEDFEHKFKQREQELSLDFDARLMEKETALEQASRRHAVELERQIDVRALEVDARWKQEVQQREEAAQVRLRQREQQLQGQADARLAEVQKQAEQDLRRRETELEHQLATQTREADTRLKQELQQKDLVFQTKLRQREQELAIRAETRETELQKQWASDLRARKEEWELEAQSRLRATETRLSLETQQKEEAVQARSKQREQELTAQLTAQAEARQTTAQAQWVTDSERKMLAAIEPFKALLARSEKERDEARQTAAESARHIQNLEKKLSEASSFLNGWRNGKSLVGAG